jgi:hypothetical protein
LARVRWLRFHAVSRSRNVLLLQKGGARTARASVPGMPTLGAQSVTTSHSSHDSDRVGLAWCDTSWVSCSSVVENAALHILMMIKGAACFFSIELPHSSTAGSRALGEVNVGLRGHRARQLQRLSEHHSAWVDACLLCPPAQLYLDFISETRSEKCSPGRIEKTSPLIPGPSQYEKTRCGQPIRAITPKADKASRDGGQRSWVPLFSTV